MKVAFVLTGFFPTNKAGTENYVFNLAKGLLSAGHEILVIIPSFEKEIGSYEYNGIKVITIPDSQTPSKKSLGGIIPPENLKYFEKVLSDIKPDIVHFHANNRFINSYHLKKTQKLGIRSVFTSHLSGIFCIKGNLMYLEKTPCNGKVKMLKCTACYIHQKRQQRLLSYLSSIFINIIVFSKIHKWIFPSWNIIKHKKSELVRLKKYCDSVISLSDWISNTYNINGVKNVHLIPQTIDFPEIQSNQKINSDNVFQLTFIGRISKIKGVHLLVEAVKELKKIYLLKLNIAGIFVPEEKDYYFRLKKMCEQLGICKWSENLEKTALIKIINQSHLICLPSTVAEMAPLTILEAFQYKVPVLGTNIGGIADMVKHNVNGLLFKINDIDDLKKQLTKMITNKDLYQTLKSNIQPPSPFKTLVEKHIALYSNLLDYND